MLRYPPDTQRLVAELEATPGMIFGGRLLVADNAGVVGASYAVDSSGALSFELLDDVRDVVNGAVSLHAVRTGGEGPWSLSLRLTAHHGGASVSEDKASAEADAQEKLLMVSFRAKE